MRDYSLENVTYNKYRKNQFFIGELSDSSNGESQSFCVWTDDGQRSTRSFNQMSWEIDLLLSDVHLLTEIENNQIKRSIKSVGIVQEEGFRLGRLIDGTKHKSDYPTDTYSIASIYIVDVGPDGNKECLLQAGYYDIDIQINVPTKEYDILLSNFKDQQLCKMTLDVLIWSWFNDHALLFCGRHEVLGDPRFRFDQSIKSLPYTARDIRRVFEGENFANNGYSRRTKGLGSSRIGEIIIKAIMFAVTAIVGLIGVLAVYLFLYR
jgi:hypothetical protein